MMIEIGKSYRFASSNFCLWFPTSRDLWTWPSEADGLPCGQIYVYTTSPGKDKPVEILTDPMRIMGIDDVVFCRCDGRYGFIRKAHLIEVGS